MAHDQGRNGVLPHIPVTGGRTVPATGNRRRNENVAISISYLASPPVMSLTAYLLVASQVGGLRAWLWTASHVLLAIAFPVAVLVAMVRRREVSDLEILRRRQRIMPLMFSLTLSGYSLFLMEVGVAPLLLRQLTFSSTLLLLGLLVVTRYWKISVHTAGVALCGALVWAVWGTSLYLIAAVGAMGLARVYIKRHTFAQVVAGGVLGLVSGLPLFLI